jgi:hypothetical protein
MYVWEGKREGLGREGREGREGDGIKWRAEGGTGRWVKREV